ncbi:hypothetical protein PROFUN_00114 [Planoprotostelium fungivorum]|uniref:Protein kinase domain-containing protein n=1 Tax=Planoprotostelium fungivorum TaxID=1890364 RepID=A0A2P6P0N6_9EUKA|nr:hypothetical protein PROFUN_00114 [Planoprotostelium fungivorum]
MSSYSSCSIILARLSLKSSNPIDVVSNTQSLRDGNYIDGQNARTTLRRKAVGRQSLSRRKQPESQNNCLCLTSFREVCDGTLSDSGVDRDKDMVDAVVNYDDLKFLSPVSIHKKTMMANHRTEYGGNKVTLRAEWRSTPVVFRQTKGDPNVTSQQLQDFMNVVFFCGLTFIPQPLGIITEFCPVSLRNYLARHELKLEEKIKIIIGIAQGINHLHEEKIIHRNINSFNIMLSDDLQPKLSDFAMSRRVPSILDEMLSDSPFGLPQYSAPEAISRQVYHGKTDVFSFGVLMWEVWTKGVPWDSFSHTSVCDMVVTAKRRLNVPIDAPEILQLLMRGCWEHESENRPSFVEICRSVERISPSQNEQ